MPPGATALPMQRGSPPATARRPDASGQLPRQPSALGEGVDRLDHLAVMDAQAVLGGVAEMRRQHEVVELAEGMVRWQRLDGEHVDAGAWNPLLLQRLEQRLLVHDRPARGVDEEGGRLHPRYIGGPDQPARALPQHPMDADDIGL